jgi:uncharacterized protein (TIGR01244 family)
MDIRPVADGFAVSGQIQPDDIREIAAAGYKTVISNRPDSEDGAVPHEEIRKAAEAAGLEFHYIPVVSGAVTADDVTEMASALENAKQPVFAYCRSGTRSANLYGLVQQAKR